MHGSVVKALTPKKAWGQVKHCDLYLRGQLEKQKQEGTEKTSPELYDALNCHRDHFTQTLMMQMKRWGTKKVKAYEYVQSFSPEDVKAGLTAETVHQMGMEFAARYFDKVPCLVVTHTDTDHLHNQFLVGNVKVDTGRCLKLSPAVLEDMKQFSGDQCLEHGLENSLFRTEVRRRPQKETDKEVMMKKHGKVTDKEQIIAAAHLATEDASSMEEFIRIMLERYEIKVRVTANTISFLGPGMKRAVRGERLGLQMTKKEIERGIELIHPGAAGEYRNRVQAAQERGDRERSGEKEKTAVAGGKASPGNAGRREPDTSGRTGTATPGAGSAAQKDGGDRVQTEEKLLAETASPVKGSLPSPAQDLRNLLQHRMKLLKRRGLFQRRIQLIKEQIQKLEKAIEEYRYKLGWYRKTDQEEKRNFERTKIR